MRRATDVLCVVYGWLVRLYPPPFRKTFADEMRAVFEAAADEAGSRGWRPLLALWLGELRDWPAALLSAYGWWVRRVRSQIRWQGGVTMAKTWKGGDGGRRWAIDEGRRAVLAALPPLIMGVGIAAASMVDGGTWFDLTIWQQGLLILLTALPVGILGVGGLIALIRSIPDWSYAWAGGTFVAATVALKILAEERAEVGAPIVSPGVDVALALALVLAGGVVLIVAAWRGWAQAGLTSIGFVSVFGIATFSMVRAAPFHRNDLVLLAAPLGLLQASLTYVYVRGRRPKLARWMVLASIWLLNGAPMLVAHRVWQPWLAERGRTSPILPLLIIVTVLAWAGPVAGLLGQPFRRSLNRA